MFINNLKTGLKREKETHFVSDYMFDEDGESSKVQLISLKEHQIWENQFHELNTCSLDSLLWWTEVLDV